MRNAGFSRITVRPLGGALGAEVEGVDFSRPLDEETRREVRRAWHENLVLFFRGQQMDPAKLEAAVENFGKPSITYYVPPVDGSRYVTRLLRLAETAGGRNYGDRWHMDQTTRERPNAGFLLYNADCPPYGGDTLFSNLYLAYETLSDGMKALCDRLVVIHTAAGLYGKDGQGGAEGAKPMMKQGSQNSFNISSEQLRELLDRETEHPLVRVHPETGRKTLYLAGAYCTRFKDMTEAESRPLLDYLQAHIERPEHTCRFRWSQGTIAMVDNRCLQHVALNDYAGFRREMLRVEIDDVERPYGPAMPRAAAEAAAAGAVA
jgi:taurine dioxygenase